MLVNLKVITFAVTVLTVMLVGSTAVLETRKGGIIEQSAYAEHGVRVGEILHFTQDGTIGHER
jgi:hypothetical protein